MCLDGRDLRAAIGVENSDAAVDVNLATGTGTGGHAEGDSLVSIENLTGSAYNDTLTGNAATNVIDGGTGDDIIHGGVGLDDGNDTLTGGAGDDTIQGGIGDDIMRGGHGDDTFVFSDGDFGIQAWTDTVDGQGTDGHPESDYDTIDLTNVTQGWTLEVDGAGEGPEATNLSDPSQYTNGGEFSGTITFDDGSAVVFDNIEKVDW